MVKVHFSFPFIFHLPRYAHESQRVVVIQLSLSLIPPGGDEAGGGNKAHSVGELVQKEELKRRIAHMKHFFFTYLY